MLWMELLRKGRGALGRIGWTCTTDWDYSCLHCDESKRNFGASIKLYTSPNISPCWGHTSYMIFQLGNGKYRFSQIHIRYGTTEICGLTWNKECNFEPWDCLPSHGTFEGIEEDLPASYPKQGGMWCPPNKCPEESDGTTSPWKLPVEVSIDGVNWTKIGEIPFDYWKHGTEVDLILDKPVEARFIRIRQPEDVEDRSLCGYLDSVHMNIPDLQLVQEDTNIQVESGEIILDGTNSLDSINGHLIGEKTRYFHHTVGNRECEDILPTLKTCPCSGWNLVDGIWLESARYHFAGGSHAATWFAGFGKKWMVKSIVGTVTLVSYRKYWFSASDTCKLVVQISNDGVTWETLQEITVLRDGDNQVNIQLDTPKEARFIRVFPKTWKWSSGSIPPSWVVDANLTLTSQGVAEYVVPRGSSLQLDGTFKNVGGDGTLWILYAAGNDVDGTPKNFQIIGYVLEEQVFSSGEQKNIQLRLRNEGNLEGAGVVDILVAIGKYDGNNFYADDYRIFNDIAYFE